MIVLFIGDIVGKSSREKVKQTSLQSIKGILTSTPLAIEYLS